ncbi:molecular chaperone Hsp70 [Mycobacterium tuberculosis]|uniref:Molecular chaperone Hsp70 n=8 Tax=Mycobacterium tuberculosis TaxID=1773 RepID=A0A654TV88_MYCTX|nr:molecular chaperone Hsp70 [Mycobacterium tuberculosis]CFS39185.1 molecular chaperone Hsp70 [Mycobacterium tuberculosis]CKT01870.1 molecular chaperone Hsp70 [Mycobacterium tuberculosis]COW24307.1 molecular chaperone Hsp70 [Mycobacterium tuberculosis]COW98480.1 molecular chaperone Hsp70 [Mycobacterium tuberculosis]
MRQGYQLGEQVLRHALVGVVDTVVVDAAELESVDDGTAVADTAENDQADQGNSADTSGEQAESEPSGS